jgi:ubiquitin fusion degradation protein 1
MLFQVENRREGRSTHCGVLEFIADEGMVYLPYWMMQNLLLQEGDVITLRSATLPKGTFVKLQPHSKDFLDISNPRAVLETTLRNFSCLTVGDTIPINYNNRQYFIDIVEAKPAEAISVIETDCNVDFAPPLDYVEPEPVFGGGGGGGNSVGGMASAGTSAMPMATDSGTTTDAEASAVVVPEEPTFLAFAGTGRRLDGKAASESQPVAIPRSKIGLGSSGGSSAAAAAPSTSGQEGASGSIPKASGSAPGRKAGKLMFKDRLAAKFGDGKAPGTAGAAAAAAPKPKEEEKPKEPENGFKAFQGTSHKLK